MLLRAVPPPGSGRRSPRISATANGPAPCKARWCTGTCPRWCAKGSFMAPRSIVRVRSSSFRKGGWATRNTPPKPFACGASTPPAARSPSPTAGSRVRRSASTKRRNSATSAPESLPRAQNTSSQAPPASFTIATACPGRRSPTRARRIRNTPPSRSRARLVCGRSGTRPIPMPCSPKCARPTIPKRAFTRGCSNRAASGSPRSPRTTTASCSKRCFTRFKGRCCNTQM